MSARGAMPRLMGVRSADMRRAEMPPATAAAHATNHPPTTPRGSLGPNSWLGWARSFRWSARGAAATSGSEETAGRSLLTSNRRFASGRRPGWLRPREVSPLRILANRSSRRRCRPLVARPLSGASSCRCTTIARSSRPHPTSCPRSTSTASERHRTPGVETPATADWDPVCAEARKTPKKPVRGVSRNPLRTPGTLLPRLTSRSSAGRPLRKCH